MNGLLFLVVILLAIGVQCRPVDDGLAVECPPKLLIEPLSYGQYQNIINTTKDKLVLVKIGTKSCRGCAFLTPGIEELAQKFKDQIVAMDVDYMVVSQPYREFHCRRVPTLVIFRNGEVVAGPFITTDKTVVEENIKEILGTSLSV